MIMTHIFSEKGEGHSKESLSAAITQAFGSALRAHKFEGDHHCNVSMIVTGSHFDGKRYHVKLRVVIFDYELAHEDLYHQLEDQRKHDQELEQNHVNQFFAAVYYTHLYHAGMSNMLDMLKGSLEWHQGDLNLKSVTFISTENFHNYLAQEFGVQPTLIPVNAPALDKAG
jgi:hypothetical protein